MINIQKSLEYLNEQYLYYACIAENNMTNLLKSLYYKKQIGLLTGDLKILAEVKETYENIEKERQKSIVCKIENLFFN